MVGGKIQNQSFNFSINLSHPIKAIPIMPPIMKTMIKVKIPTPKHERIQSPRFFHQSDKVDAYNIKHATTNPTTAKNKINKTFFFRSYLTH